MEAKILALFFGGEEKFVLPSKGRKGKKGERQASLGVGPEDKRGKDR